MKDVNIFIKPERRKMIVPSIDIEQNNNDDKNKENKSDENKNTNDKDDKTKNNEDKKENMNNNENKVSNDDEFIYEEFCPIEIYHRAELEKKK